MRLSDNFILAEFTRSQTAIRRGIDNTPTKEHIENMKLLCSCGLEPIHKHYGVPIQITSGYRGKLLNRKIGGSSSSQHCIGEAADFRVIGKTVDEVCDFVLDSGMLFDQLIWEFGSWVHLSYSKKRNRKEALRAVKHGRKTIYFPYRGE